MATRILITHQQLKSSSNKFKQTASQIEGLIKQLDSELNTLNAGWDGMAQDKFYQNWNSKNKKAFQSVKQDCEALSQKLNTVSDKMQDMDKQLASQMLK